MSDEIGDYILQLARDAARRKALGPYRAVIDAALEQPAPTADLQAALRPFLGAAA